MLAAQPRPTLSRAPPRVEFVHGFYLPEKKAACMVYYAKLPTAPDAFWPIPGLGCGGT